MKNTFFITAVFMLMTSSMPAYAVGTGDSGTKQMTHGMDAGMKGMFLTKKQVDGYMVSFHVMKAQTGHAMIGDHDFMVKIEKDGHVLSGLTVNSKIIYPDKSAKSKMMMKMGDWYMAGYDMDQKGRYQLMVLFKTPNGDKHFGGVYFQKQHQ